MTSQPTTHDIINLYQKYLLTPIITNLGMHEKDVAGIVTFGLIGLLLPNHIITYITMAYQSLRGSILMLTVK